MPINIGHKLRLRPMLIMMLVVSLVADGTASEAYVERLTQDACDEPEAQIHLSVRNTTPRHGAVQCGWETNVYKILYDDLSQDPHDDLARTPVHVVENFGMEAVANIIYSAQRLRGLEYWSDLDDLRNLKLPRDTRFIGLTACGPLPPKYRTYIRLGNSAQLCENVTMNCLFGTDFEPCTRMNLKLDDPEIENPPIVLRKFCLILILNLACGRILNLATLKLKIRQWYRYQRSCRYPRGKRCNRDL